MECMEDGYLAKIVQPDGAKEIQVGEVIYIHIKLITIIRYFF